MKLTRSNDFFKEKCVEIEDIFQKMNKTKSVKRGSIYILPITVTLTAIS